MPFNSIDFLFFFILVFTVYWVFFNRKHKLQNVFILIANYIFYGWWDWRFLSLLIFISVVDFTLGQAIYRTIAENKRKILLIFGLIVHLGILGFFKYYNFFIESFSDLIFGLGISSNLHTLRIILPIGISFYTFQTLTYVIDIYRKKLIPTKDIAAFFAFVSFFPQVLSGPIERASNLLPQFLKARVFNKNVSVDGLRLIVYGIFKKMVIADNCAVFVNEIYGNYSSYSGSTLLVATFFFAFQLYCDFSGYSDIAVGTARLLGFDLMQNFAFPYFGRNISEFWKRWHISLTTWFRDYLFLPLSVAVSRTIKSEKVFFLRADLFIYVIASTVTWLLTGLWHGADYTFIIWGLINGLFLILYQWQKKPRKKILSRIGINNKNSFLVIIETVFTFFLIQFAWIFFRSESINDALGIYKIIFSQSFLTPPEFNFLLAFLVIVLITIDWNIQKTDIDFSKWIGHKKKAIRWAMYIFIFFLYFFYAKFEGNEFIYFQF